MIDLLLLVPANAAARIAAGGRYGKITCAVSHGENLAAVTHVGTESGPVLPAALPERHWLLSGDTLPAGQWYRVPADLHAQWLACRARSGAGLALDAFANRLPVAFHRGTQFAVTWAPDAATAFPDVPVPTLVAWFIGEEGIAVPVPVATEPLEWGPGQLLPGWPIDVLASVTAIVVGVGSIGAAAAIDFATYGIGRVRLIDPDRLLWHNLIRHVGTLRDVGRPKVTALRDQLREIRPDTAVEAYELDVVEDAHHIRAMLSDTDIVVCAADGVAPRRVVSHLARRGRVDAILACVLDDGAIGELLRLRPVPDRGCLLCHRAKLVDEGALDPEPALDAPYGAGTRHLPMTAVGGDLHLVGNLAAKAAVATVLERRGCPDQQLPGERAVIGLRPRPNRPEPFDPGYAAAIRWDGPWPSRPDCPTCEQKR